MDISEFYESENQTHWLEEIEKSDWGAGKFLYELLTENRLKELCGESTRVYLLTEGNELLSFLTLAEQDDIRDESMKPWIGFVYTYPLYRGHHYAGQLLEKACNTAKEDGYECVYVSTNETGLYEKYGFSFYQIMKDYYEEDSRIYLKNL